MTRAARRRLVADGPHDSTCWRCDDRIESWTHATKHHGHWIHKTCAPGADDE